MFIPAISHAECLVVKDDTQIPILFDRLEKLKEIQMDRQAIFNALAETAKYETRGCWATPVGNFDAQYLSVGILQWNYGQNSIQQLMNGYKAKFTDDDFNKNINELMPIYGEIAFSDDCLQVPVNDNCKAQLQNAQPENKLNQNMYNEYEALFNSPKMRETQVEVFSDFLIDMVPKMHALFGDNISALKVRWAMDVAIQQGYLKYSDEYYFLKPDDVSTVNQITSQFTQKQLKNSQFNIIKWYSGLCGGIYQGVAKEQCNFNIKNWCAVINHGLNQEQTDLLNYSFLRARIAQGQSGRWQANAFARRAKIALGVGWVGLEKVKPERKIGKTYKCNKLLL